MKKRKLICIVGKSGSGKTLLTRYLNDKKGIQTIVSYTTRPMRIEETNGVDHWFVTEKDMPEKVRMLAYSKFGGYHYWADMTSLYLDDKDNFSPITYVIDEAGLKHLIDNYGPFFDIWKILIKRDKDEICKNIDTSRIDRDKSRECIADDEFDYIIYNNSTIDEFLEQGVTVINEIIND